MRAVEEEGEGAEGVGPGEGQLRLRVVGGEEMSCLRDGSLLNPYPIMTAAEYKKNLVAVVQCINFGFNLGSISPWPA